MADRKEPRTCADFERMVETSSNWFDGKITYENLAKGMPTPYPVGCRYERRIRVHPHAYNGTVMVEEVETVVTKHNGDGSWAAKHVTNWSREMAFDEFRASEFWEPAMAAFADGDADASAFAEYDAHCDGADGFVSIEMERQYTDWLGNPRLAKEHDRFECHADMAGWLTLKCGRREYDGDARELFDLIDEALAFRERGIRLDGGELRVRVPEPADEDGR